jgi:multiple sugar transport system substrate-binding protein
VLERKGYTMRPFILAVVLLLGLAQAQTQVRWFVGLGAGTDEPTIAAQQAVVDAFNASQSDIVLVLEIVDNSQAYDVLATQIASGNAPDIVGPVGVRGRESFPGAWTDLTPLLEASGYDLSDFDPALIEFYQTDAGLVGLPFAVFPSFLVYNKALFDEAGLPYPPASYGEPYVDENGEEKPWDIETLSELAMKQTVDVSGNDATMSGFDPNNIVQWGFGTMWRDIRGRVTLFGPGNFIDDEGNAHLPEHWRTGIEWYQDAMWTKHFYPNGPYGNSALLGEGNWFDSGNLAMAHVQLWYVGCCMTSLRDDWDLAALPSYNGTVTTTLNADTFSIPRGSRNPEAAFTVLSYLLSPEVSGELAAIYGGMPARTSLQDGFLNTFSERLFPGKDLNWQVAIDGLAYPDSPNHEAALPAQREAEDRYNAFTQLLENDPNINLDAELEAMLSDLQRIFSTAR